MSKKVFDLDKYLIKEGFVLDYSENRWGAIYKNDLISIRLLMQSNLIQFGFNKTFDRWANSVDYEDKIPHTKSGAHRLLNLVNDLVRCTKCTDWGEKSYFVKRHNRYYCNDCYDRHFGLKKKSKRV